MFDISTELFDNLNQKFEMSTEMFDITTEVFNIYVQNVERLSPKSRKIWFGKSKISIQTVSKSRSKTLRILCLIFKEK